MSQDDVEVVRHVYADWARGNRNAGVELFDADIVFETLMPDASERVVAKGPKEVEAFMREWLAQWRDFRLVGEEFRDIEGDNGPGSRAPDRHGT